MVTRETMETAVASKIDFILNKLEKGKTREIELIEKTKENYRKAQEEDDIVNELEEKLKTLEDTLSKTETENVALKIRLEKAESTLEADLEFNSAQEVDVVELESDHEAVSKEYIETSSHNNKLHKTANDMCDDILKLSIEVRNQEAQCQLEHERVVCLSKELQDVSTKLAAADRKRESIIQNGDELKERVEETENKRDESQTKADEYDTEIRRLEKLLDDHTNTLSAMKTEQAEREIKIEEGKQRIALELEEMEGQTKTTTIHQAQSVVKKRR